MNVCVFVELLNGFRIRCEWIISLFSDINKGRGRVENPPKDAVAEMGSDVRFNCTVNSMTSQDNLIWLHLANDFAVLHVVVHVHRDATLASGTVDEKLNQIEHRHVSVLLVRLDPIIDERLKEIIIIT